MKRVTGLLIPFAILVIIISASGLLTIDLVRSLEVRSAWLIPTLAYSLTGSFIVLFSALAVRPFVVERRGWVKVLLLIGYILFCSILAFILVTERGFAPFLFYFLISLLVVGVAVIGLLLFYRKDKWHRVLFAIHNAIFGLVAVAILIFIVEEIDPLRIREDLYVKYETPDKGLKVVAQGRADNPNYYLISHDWGFVRMRESFYGELPNGTWRMFNPKGEPIALLTVRDGAVLNRKLILPVNTFVVSDSYELAKLIQDKGDSDTLTILVDGDVELAEPISIFHKSNIILDKAPHSSSSLLRARSGACVAIDGSSNVVIQNLSLVAESSPEVVSVNTSGYVLVSKCDIAGGVRQAVGVDSKSENISIRENHISNFGSHCIAGYTFNTFVDANTFSQNGKKESAWSIKFYDKHYTDSIPYGLLERALLEFDNDYYEDIPESVVLWGNSYPKVEGTLDLLIDVFDIYSLLSDFSKSVYSPNFYGDYPYCTDFVSYLMGEPLFASYGKGDIDSWFWGSDGYLKFYMVNPQFFRAMRAKVRVNGLQPINGEPLQKIYSLLFSKVFRGYYNAYLFLQDLEAMQSNISRYKEFVDSGGWDVDLFVFHHIVKPRLPMVSTVYYSNTDEGYTEDATSLGPFYQKSKLDLSLCTVMLAGEEVNAKALSKMVSFWLRRNMDGSAQEIFLTMEHFMNELDREWIRR